MVHPCPFCGDPLSREPCNRAVRRHRGRPEPVARWFYTCETCGREYHGFERPWLRLVPLTPDEDAMAPAAVSWVWNDRPNERHAP
jgi:uncharacterized protein with PIN domain